MKRTNTAVWLEKYNRWQINVQKDGVRKTFTCATPGRNGQRDCNKKADLWLDDNITKTNSKIKDISTEYINNLKMVTSQSHWRQYEGYFKNHINPIIGHIKIDCLSEQHLQNVINKSFSKGSSKKTLMNLRACELNFLKYCRKGKFTNLFVEGLDIPKGAKGSEKNILTPSDINKLMTIDTKIERNQSIFEQFINAYRFQVLTGLRPGEVIGLKWSDIKGEYVFVKRSINAFGEITTGKNENAKRNFKLNEYCIITLAHQKKKMKELGIISDYIFPTIYGDPVIHMTYWKHWKQYCKTNGLTDTSPYELRHTFVSIVKTLPEGYLKQIVGHSKDMDTYGVYSHDTEGDKEKSAQMVQDIFADLIED